MKCITREIEKIGKSVDSFLKKKNNTFDLINYRGVLCKF